MPNHTKQFILPFITCFLFATAILYGQDDLPTGEVDVVRSFEARLGDAERVRIQPILPPLDTSVRQQQYNISARPVVVDYMPPSIRPRGLRRQRTEPGKNGYLKLGAGFPRAFYGDLSYDYTKNEQFDAGFNAFHNSANNDNDIENQRFSFTRFDVDGTFYSEQGPAVEGSLGYQTQSIYYYGYNDLNEELDPGQEPFSFEPEDVRQRFNMVDLSARIFNAKPTVADFNYSAGIDIYLLDDEFATRENGYDLQLRATKWFNDKDPLDILLRTDFTNYKDTSRQTLNNFYLNPTYTLHGDRFQLQLGFNLTSSNDDFTFFPDVEATANIVEGVVSAFVGADGSLYKNNLRSLSEYNPFIRTRLRLRNSEYYRFYGGVKGNVSGATYRAEVSYKNVDRLALFQLPISVPLDSIPRFDVLYDTANVVTLQGTVILPLFENFLFNATVAQHIFDLEREEKPFHLPSFTLNSGLAYTTPDEKAIVKADFYLENGVPYRTPEGDTDNLNALFDISMTVEYFFTESIGGFITLNNIAGNNRQRWFRYPIFGLNGLFGLTARF